MADGPLPHAQHGDGAQRGAGTDRDAARGVGARHGVVGERVSVSLPAREDVERAIQAIEGSRESHVAWIGHNPDGCADCQRAAPGQLVGDDAHHQACIAKYDQVLNVLRLVREHTEPPVFSSSGA